MLRNEPASPNSCAGVAINFPPRLGLGATSKELYVSAPSRTLSCATPPTLTMIPGFYHYVAMTGDIAEDDFKPQSQWSEDATGTSHCHPNVLSYLAAVVGLLLEYMDR